MMNNPQRKPSLQLVNSMTFKSSPVAQLIEGLNQQISYYKNALENVLKTIDAYKNESQYLQQENMRLEDQCLNYQKKMKQLIRSLIKQQQQKTKELQMMAQIQDLNKKLAMYQKTIQILQDKLLILNVAIKKHQYKDKVQENNLSQKLNTNVIQRTSSNKSKTIKTQNRLTNITKVQKPLFFKQKSNSIYDTPQRFKDNSIRSNKLKCKRTYTQQPMYITDQLTDLTTRSSKYS